MRRGAAYIEELIAQGEHQHQDFKLRIDDARKIARSVAAFANNDGGRLLIGVKDNGTVAGVSGDEETYMVELAATRYCRPAQQPHFISHNVHGKVVVEAIIDRAEQRPVTAPDEHGTYVAYYRVDDENVIASHVHERVLEGATPDTISIGEREQQLLEYLSAHGAITTTGVARLLHCSAQTAEDIIVSLCSLHVARLDYHAGTCIITEE